MNKEFGNSIVPEHIINCGAFLNLVQGIIVPKYELLKIEIDSTADDPKIKELASILNRYNNYDLANFSLECSKRASDRLAKTCIGNINLSTSVRKLIPMLNNAAYDVELLIKNEKSHAEYYKDTNRDKYGTNIRFSVVF